MCQGRTLFIVYFKNRRLKHSPSYWASITHHWPGALSKRIYLHSGRPYYKVNGGDSSVAFGDEHAANSRLAREIEEILRNNPLPTLGTDAPDPSIRLAKSDAPDWIDETEIWIVADVIEYQSPETFDYLTTMVFVYPAKKT